MSKTTLRNIAIVVGVLLFMPAFVISPGLAIVLALIVVGAGYVAMQAIGKSQTKMKNFEGTDLLEKMWIPVRDELSQVVRMGGRVTAASSVWTGVPNLYKQETPATFHQGMERYVNKRAQVAPLVASASTTEENRHRQEMEQQDLLLMSRDLLEEAKKVMTSIPGSETAVRRAAASRTAPSAQQASSAARRPSAASGVGTRQPSSVSRSSQAQTATPSRTMQPRPTPPRPAPAPMRVRTPRPPRPAAAPSGITDTLSSPEPVVPSPPSRPSPTPLKITDTSAPPEPAVPPPAPREPEPPAAPSVPQVPPTPLTASVPEPVEPVVATPAPSEPEPAAPPSDLRLDIASVCEDLFNPDMMSYQANRLFDDRYKDATVRWKGTARRASAYSYDFNFGDGGGTKAELDIYEVKQQYGSRTVKAVVQLPVEAADDLGARIGEDIEFEGRLMTCEGSARRVYVADARMVG